MSNIKIEFGTSGTLTITLASLGTGAGRRSTAIDNSTNKYISLGIRVKIKTGAAGVSSTGYAAVYLIRSEDGTNFDDGFGGLDAAYTPVNAILLGIISATVNATTYQKVFNLDEMGITLPKCHYVLY